MRFVNKIHAALSRVLYHKTNETNAIKILKDRKFRLSTWLGGSGVDKGSEKLWFLSTSTRPGAFKKGSSGVVFVLDGSSINKDYEGDPFDYWGEAYHKASGGDTDEAEERVYSDKPLIPIHYITEIHADWYIGNKGYEAHAYKRHRDLTLLAKKLNIPIYWYESHKSLDSLNKQEAKKFSDFPKGPELEPEERDYQTGRSNREGSVSKYFYEKWKALLSIEPAKSKKDLPFKNMYQYLSSYSDGHTGFKSDIHNASKGGEAGEMKYIYKLQKQMERVGAKDFKEFYWKMIDKLYNNLLKEPG